MVTTRIGTRTFLVASLFPASLLAAVVCADQPPPPCHPNPKANQDMAEVRNRGDVRHLPDPLEDRLVRMAGRPHSQLPTQPTRRRTRTSRPSRLYPASCFSTTSWTRPASSRTPSLA